MDRITVLDDDGDNIEATSNKSKIPQTKECVRTPESDENMPSCSGTHNNTELSDMVTPDKSSSSYHKSITNNVRISDTSGVTTTTEANTSSSSVTQTKKLPTILSNREVYENIDNIPRPSYWLPETEPEKKEEEEIDDFEYLGMLDDGYLLSLFDEDKETEEIPNTTQTQNSVPTVTTAERDNIQEDFSKTELVAAAGKASKNRRSNPPRVAKEGVTYRDDNDNLEEVLQSEYCKLLQRREFTYC